MPILKCWDGNSWLNLTSVDNKTCRFIIGSINYGWTWNDCDYLCDGEQDQLVINAAIQALPSTGGGDCFS